MNQEQFQTRRSCAKVAAGILFAGAFLSASLAAQQEGPMKLPSPPPTAPAPASSRPAAVRPSSSSQISNEPPSIPVEQIIQRFAQHEAEFRTERENYTYTQTFVIQTIDTEGRPDGEYKLKSEIVFTPSGKRYEKVTYAPAPTLERISLSQQDLDDLEHVQPFVLTTEELPKYDVKYVGRQDLDEVSTYVFDVGPKTLVKNQRYFQGRIWVDDRDFGIVKSYGKAVPDIRKKNNENIFPHFETFRENIEGHFWFPTYTRSDDVLHYTFGDIHIRMTVRYANYQRFNVTIKLGDPTEVKPDHP
ncbi:MAG TPA: hypothetical protein VGR03_09565 [Candidatus Acidoferrum sp.]|nr:hypothetical protein [Candidatus Acidoferrum sp.]